MNPIVPAMVVVVLGINSFACSDPESDPSNRSVPEPSSKAINEAAPRSVMKPDPLPELTSSDESLVVPATANIFAAGRNSNQLMAAAPGGGGAGTLPPGWHLRPGSKRVVTFPTVTGRVNFWTETAEWNGPAGDTIRDTDVESYQGISGLVHHRNGSFLVGVFLTKESPLNPAPPRLNFTGPAPSDVIAPEIGQVFLIGDGTNYRYTVPPAATRLFLGFVDGRLWQGSPGWYDNNSGKLKSSIAVMEG